MNGTVRRHYRVGQREAEHHQNTLMTEEKKRKYMALGGLLLFFCFLQGLVLGMFIKRD